MSDSVHVDGYLSSGRMVRSAHRRKCTRNKKPAWTWKDASDCGGTYDDLYEWMRVSAMCYDEPVRFVIRNEVPKDGSADRAATQDGSAGR